LLYTTDHTETVDFKGSSYRFSPAHGQRAELVFSIVFGYPITDDTRAKSTTGNPWDVALEKEIATIHASNNICIALSENEFLSTVVGRGR
jgi:hypothetical protein